MSPGLHCNCNYSGNICTCVFRYGDMVMQIPVCRGASRYLLIFKRKKDYEVITVNLRYTGENGAALAFAKEMTASGTVDAIRAEEGNIRYEYYISLDDPQTVLLIDSWRDQAAIDAHHASPMMKTIASLREKYDLHMTVERYVDAGGNTADEKFIRK